MQRLTLIENVNRDACFDANRLSSAINRESAFCEDCGTLFRHDKLQWVTANPPPPSSQWFGSSGIVTVFGMRSTVVTQIADLLKGFHLMGVVDMDGRFVPDWIGLVPTKTGLVPLADPEPPHQTASCRHCGQPGWLGINKAPYTIHENHVPNLQIFAAADGLILNDMALDRLRAIRIAGLDLQFNRCPVNVISR